MLDVLLTIAIFHMSSLLSDDGDSLTELSKATISVIAILIGCSAITFLIGICGACARNRCLLNTYVFGMIAVISMLMGITGLVYFKPIYVSMNSFPFR